MSTIREFPTQPNSAENAGQHFTPDETYDIAKAVLRKKNYKAMRNATWRIYLAMFVLAIVDIATVYHLMAIKSLDELGNPTHSPVIILLAACMVLGAYFLIGELLKSAGALRVLGVSVYLAVLAFLSSSASQVHRDEILQLWGANPVANIVSNLLDTAASTASSMPHWFFLSVSLIFGVVYTAPGLAIIVLSRKAEAKQKEWAIFHEADAVVKAQDLAQEKIRRAHIDIVLAESALQEVNINSNAKNIINNGLTTYCKTLQNIQDNNVVRLTDAKDKKAEKQQAAAKAANSLKKFQENPPTLQD